MLFDKIVRDSKKLTLYQLQELHAHLEKEIRGRKESRSAAREVVEEKTVGSTCFSLVKIRCGKKECKCSRGELHGPYWYAYYSENGKTRCKYVGKTLPDIASILKFSKRLREKARKTRAQCIQIRDPAEEARVEAR